MAREKGDYTEHIQRLDPATDDGPNLIGPLQHVVRALLTKHFMLEDDDAGDRKP